MGEIGACLVIDLIICNSVARCTSGTDVLPSCSGRRRRGSNCRSALRWYAFIGNSFSWNKYVFSNVLSCHFNHFHSFLLLFSGWKWGLRGIFDEVDSYACGRPFAYPEVSLWNSTMSLKFSNDNRFFTKKNRLLNGEIRKTLTRVNCFFDVV